VLAISFGILASFCFAVSTVLAQRGLHLAPTPWGAWITLAANAVFLWAFHFLLYPSAPILAVQNLVFVAIGLFVPGLTRVLTFRGIRVMGSAVTATVVNATPMFSTFLAMLILRERPGPLVLLGAALIVAGLIAISWEGERRSWKRTELLFPEKFSLPDGNAVTWFMASGLFTGGSFLFMYLALSMERVSIVGPLVNSYAVFVLMLAPFLARRIEMVTARKTAGAALVVLGIFLISAGRNQF
jgi:drug/metabolite transporter (DMT)-like permease